MEVDTTTSVSVLLLHFAKTLWISVVNLRTISYTEIYSGKQNSDWKMLWAEAQEKLMQT